MNNDVKLLLRELISGVPPQSEAENRASTDRFRSALTGHYDETQRAVRQPSRRRFSARQGLVVTAVLLSVVLVVALVVAIGSGRPSTDLKPVAPRIPRDGFLTVPVQGSGHTLVVWSWDGRKVHTIRTGPKIGIGCCVTPSLSPDGERILVQDSTGLGAQVITTTGRVIASGSNWYDAIWANDSRHLCALTYPPGPPSGSGTLVVIDPGGGTRIVGKVPGLADHTNADIASCDVDRQTAVVVRTFMGAETTVIYVNLTNDAQHDAPWIGRESQIAALSGNGLFAVTLEGRVISTTSGRVVAQVKGQPVAISWLGHVVFSLTDNFQAPVAYDWQTHKTVWQPKGWAGSCPCTSPKVFARSRTGTDDMALNVAHGTSDTASLWLVAPGGAVRVSADVAPMTP